MEMGIVIVVFFFHLMANDLFKDYIAIESIDLKGEYYALNGTKMVMTKTVVLKRYYR